ncbi:contact-dependent growth inhibition system immunity protein [Ralstonia pseudosolanacearum]|uniref:contact-dependent growth inhibition system immunity protein n=1 Tax=Ralstonia pseudosolanacearum TaxID=1310165 RepID=UPI0018D17734|nr:contact-dependent growth inhibition system immunity protein [Ralstonia pseudosolanacearum]
MEKIAAVANAYFNGNFFYICTMSQGVLDYVDPDAAPHYLEPGANDAEIGEALRSALRESKCVSTENFQSLFKSGVIQNAEQERSAGVMARYGYKTKRAMYKNMRCCWIKLQGGVIEIKPTFHKSMDSYAGLSSGGPEIIHLRDAVSDVELGAALREGFARCTGAL